MVRLISTQTQGVSKNVPDMWIRSLDYVSEAIRFDVGAAIRRQKNTDKKIGAIRAVILGTLLSLEKNEIVKNVELYKDKLLVERMPENIGFFSVKIPTDIVLGLHGIIGHVNLIVS
jgi:phage tail sheath gpL-like